MRQSPWAASKDRFAWQLHDPWSSSTGPYVTLHPYWPSGEFICEDFVFLGLTVDIYSQYLEEGLILEDIKLESEEDGVQKCYYKLVWKETLLEDEWHFYDIVPEFGMSSTEPNDVIVIHTVSAGENSFEEEPREP